MNIFEIEISIYYFESNQHQNKDIIKKSVVNKISKILFEVILIIFFIFEVLIYIILLYKVITIHFT